MCNMLDFDALFDLHFKNKLCCDYQVIDESPLLATQTFIVKPAEVFWSPERCEKAMEWLRRDD